METNYTLYCPYHLWYIEIQVMLENGTIEYLNVTISPLSKGSGLIFNAQK